MQTLLDCAKNAIVAAVLAADAQGQGVSSAEKMSSLTRANPSPTFLFYRPRGRRAFFKEKGFTSASFISAAVWISRHCSPMTPTLSPPPQRPTTVARLSERSPQGCSSRSPLWCWRDYWRRRRGRLRAEKLVCEKPEPGRHPHSDFVFRHVDDTDPRIAEMGGNYVAVTGSHVEAVRIRSHRHDCNASPAW